MLTIKKYKKLFFVAILLSLLSLTIVIKAAGEQAIDINEIAKSNPFMQLRQSPNRIHSEMAIKPDLVVETTTLKFLDAKSVKTSIANMSSEYGSIEPDSKGNTLIICDTNENLNRILAAQIHKIDRKPDQIMIEVVLLDVTLNDNTEIGVNWDLLTANTDRDAIFRQNLTSSRLGSTIANPANTGDATAFNTTGTGSDLWLLWAHDIRTVIHVLQKKNDVEILASPRVMVVSGQTASIEAVEEIPYSNQSDTSNGGQLTSTEFKNVGVKLIVVATLTDDKLILLNVNTEQNVQTGTSVVTGGVGASGVPIVDTRKVNSSLLLNDGQILVIGGLRRKETKQQTNQLPILGDLPIVGYAFKSTLTTYNSSELLVLLSPHIYNNEKPSEAQMEKYNEITQRPLLTIPQSAERKKDEQKKEAEKIKAQEKEKMKKEKSAKKMSK